MANNECLTKPDIRCLHPYARKTFSYIAYIVSS